jgi:hypothetical protein
MESVMKVSEILSRIERLTGRFEREAVEAAVARREEVTPELLGVLEKIADPDQAYQLDIEGDYMAPLYAMYLLAQFRETRAYPLVVRIALLDGELLYSLFGDFVTEGLGRVLASVCGGNIEEIQAIVENADADEWVRGAALGGLVTLVAAGMKSREEILSYFAALFRGKLGDKNQIVWSDLVIYSADLSAPELLGDIERAYAEGLVDPGMVGLIGVRRDLAKGEEWALASLATNPHRRLVDDTVKEMQWWACFKENEKLPLPAEVLDMASANPWQEDSFTGFKRALPKIGRNDPCPCGSGKKYKKCCGG